MKPTVKAPLTKETNLESGFLLSLLSSFIFIRFIFGLNQVEGGVLTVGCPCALDIDLRCTFILLLLLKEVGGLLDVDEQAVS